MTSVDPNVVMCDYCAQDARPKWHEHSEVADGKSCVTTCCGCECARWRAHLAKLDRERERQKRRDLDSVVEQCRVDHEAGADAFADRIERRIGCVA